MIAARFWDEDDMRALRLMTDAAHEHGALAGLELHHGGAHAPDNVTRLPALGPSQLASRPRAERGLQGNGTRRHPAVRDDWVAASVRARDCGFDIVYVYGAHSYLPMQFLSSFYNKRTDAYGGSLPTARASGSSCSRAYGRPSATTARSSRRIAVEALGPAASTSTRRLGSSRSPTRWSTCGT